MMDALPLLEQLVVEIARELTIDDHGVRDVAEKAQVRVGAFGLLDDHLLQVEHYADRRDLGIREHLAHAVRSTSRSFSDAYTSSDGRGMCIIGCSTGRAKRIARRDHG